MKLFEEYVKDCVSKSPTYPKHMEAINKWHNDLREKYKHIPDKIFTNVYHFKSPKN